MGETGLLAGLSEGALELAIRASGAVLVDTGLLRRLRLRFIRSADASIESEVWHWDEIASETSNGISFTRPALDTLRARLQASRWVDDTCAEIAAYHAGGPPLLLLEEELVRHALNLDIQKVEGALMSVLASLDRETSTRGTAILHWANHALPRLPAAARDTTAAWTLAFATERHVGRAVLEGQPPAALAGIDLREYLPQEDVELRVRGTEAGLILGGAEGHALSVAKTDPRFVTIDDGTDRRVVSVPAGAEVKVDGVRLPVELGDLRGRRWRVEEGETDGDVEPVTVRFLVVMLDGLTPENEAQMREALRRMYFALGGVDQVFVVDDARSDRIWPWPESTARRIMSAWDGVPESDALVQPWSMVVERAHHRIGVVGSPARPLLPGIEEDVAAALGNGPPALWREEVDLAVLISVADPTISITPRGEDVMKVFDVKITSSPTVDATALVPFLWGTTGGACALVVDLELGERGSHLIRCRQVDADANDIESTEQRVSSPRRTGSRAQTRREIIRALHGGKNVLVVGSQATGKTVLIAEIVGGPWLKIARAPTVAAALQQTVGPDAVAAEFDPGQDLEVLEDMHFDLPLLLESPLLPFVDEPAIDEQTWHVCKLGRLMGGDVLDALAHVPHGKQGAIARYLLKQTGGDPWLIWKAIAGAKLHDPGEVASYAAQLARAAVGAVSDLDDPAAIELLVALSSGPRPSVDPRAMWRLESLGLAHTSRGMATLTSPVVRQVVGGDVVDLRIAALGTVPDDPELWVALHEEISDEWAHAVAMAIASCGFGLIESPGEPSAVARALAKLRTDAWVQSGMPERAHLVISVVMAPQTERPYTMIPSSFGPDQVYAHLSEWLDAKAHEARHESPGRPLSVLLDELGVLDPRVVSVRRDQKRRKVNRLPWIAEIGSARRERVSEVEASRLIAAGARTGRATAADADSDDEDGERDDVQEVLETAE